MSFGSLHVDSAFAATTQMPSGVAAAWSYRPFFICTSSPPLSMLYRPLHRSVKTLPLLESPRLAYGELPCPAISLVRYDNSGSSGGWTASPPSFPCAICRHERCAVADSMRLLI